MAPIVHDQARTLLKHLVTATIIAEEVRLHTPVPRHHHLAAHETIGRHGLEASIGLLAGHIFPA